MGLRRSARRAPRSNSSSRAPPGFSARPHLCDPVTARASDGNPSHHLSVSWTMSTIELGLDTFGDVTLRELARVIAG